ncbi:hypothetical protein [Haliangium sp.]|uniref:hypothetical protein n=1 Tax=Haliangium sp. TaxID=2663208 RepID=UPI003D0DF86B
MKVPKPIVADVVSEASTKMSDPNFSAVMVGGFVQTQQPTAQYISAHEGELGGTENVVNVIFHAALIGQCFQRAGNREVRTMNYDDLDHVADGADPLTTLATTQPAIHEYISSNVDDPEARQVLALIARAMDWVS